MGCWVCNTTVLLLAMCMCLCSAHGDTSDEPDCAAGMDFRQSEQCKAVDQDEDEETTHSARDNNSNNSQLSVDTGRLSQLEMQLIGTASELQNLRMDLQTAVQQVNTLAASLIKQEAILQQLAASHAQLTGQPIPPPLQLTPGHLTSSAFDSPATPGTHRHPIDPALRQRWEQRGEELGLSSWMSKFLLLSVLQPGPGSGGQLGEEVTAVGPLMTELFLPTAERPARYVAVGSSQGRVLLFSTRGALVLSHATGTTSPVTALTSWALRKNESALVTGHTNGEVRTHVVHLLQLTAGQEGGIKQVVLRHVLEAGKGRVRAFEPAPITHLLSARPNSRSQTRRQVVAWDTNGWVRVQRENGTLRMDFQSNVTHLAVTTSGTTVLALSGQAAHMHKLQGNGPYRRMQCLGLNGTSMLAAAFDPARPYRAYAINDAHQLLVLVVPNEGKPGACRVVRWQRLALPGIPLDPTAPRPTLSGGPGSSPGSSGSSQRDSFEGDRSMASSGGSEGDAGRRPPEAGVDGAPALNMSLMALRGYLVLMIPGAGAAVLNTSSIRLVPSPVVAETWASLAGGMGMSMSEMFGCEAMASVSGSATATGLVFLPLGCAGVAVLESELPISANLAISAGSAGKNYWAQPLFVGAMMLVGIWQFFKAQRRSEASQFRGMRGSGQGARHRPGSTSLLQNMGLDLAPRSSEREQRALYSRMGNDDFEDFVENQAKTANLGVRRPTAKDPHKAFGGFTGPRSARRAMRLGIPPGPPGIPEENEDEEEDD